MAARRPGVSALMAAALDDAERSNPAGADRD